MLSVCQMAAGGAPVQVLICMKGHPGCGKSTLATCLARELRAALVDKDDARDAFEAVSAEQPALDIDWNALSYKVMFAVVDRQLSVGLSVVMDCPLSRRSLYDTACAAAVKVSARILVVECVCSDETVWRARLENRGQALQGTEQSHRPCTWDDLQGLLARYEDCWRWSEDPVVDRVLIDTAKMTNPAEAVRVVLQHLLGRDV